MGSEMCQQSYNLSKFQYYPSFKQPCKKVEGCLNVMSFIGSRSSEEGRRPSIEWVLREKTKPYITIQLYMWLIGGGLVFGFIVWLVYIQCIDVPPRPERANRSKSISYGLDRGV